MPVQYRFRPQHLALAIALAVGCIAPSLAQQPEPQVMLEEPTPKSRKRKPKLNEPIVDLPVTKEIIEPHKNADRPTNRLDEGQTAQL